MSKTKEDSSDKRLAPRPPISFAPAAAIRSKEPAAGTQAARRIISILRLMSAHQNSGLRFIDVADHLGLERSTAHRMLKTLDEEGVIFRDGATKRYFLGPLMFQLGLVAAQKFNLQEICEPSLRRLAEITHDTAFLFVRAGIDAVCIGRVQGDHPIQTPSVPLGGRQPLGVSAGGLALLAAMPRQEVEKVIHANRPSLGKYGGLTANELLHLVDETKRNDYALIGERAVPGVTAVGMAIRNQDGLPLAALAVATTTERMNPARQREIIPFLRQEAQRISTLLNQ